MNKIERLYSESSDLKQYIKGYYKYLFELLDSIDKDEIIAFTNEFKRARIENNTIFFIGNGGSAATASHMANDFGMDILKKSGTNIPIRAMSLTDNAAVMLAVSNDDGYERLFVNQLRVLYRPGDKLVAISASGNSPNVVAAAKWVKQQGGTVMSLVGFDGGRLKDISDIVIHVRSGKGEYGPVEDIHMIMDHMLANWLQYHIQHESRGEKT